MMKVGYYVWAIVSQNETMGSRKWLGTWRPTFTVIGLGVTAEGTNVVEDEPHLLNNFGLTQPSSKLRAHWRGKTNRTLSSSLRSWLPVKTREWKRLGNSVEKHDSWTLPQIAKGHWTSKAVPPAKGWVTVQPFRATLHPELRLWELLIKADTRALVTVKRSKRNFPDRSARGVMSLFHILSV